MNPLFVSPVEEGASFQRAVIVDSADREQKTKEHFQISLGEWVSLTPLTCLSFCFPLCFSLSHLALWVLTVCLSGVLLLGCPHTHSSFKTYHHLSIPPLCLTVFASYFVSSFSPYCRSAEICARCSCVCDGKKHVAVPCHDQHSSMPVNDTWRHPMVHITMVARLSAGWISGKKSHFGSAPGAGYSGGDISDSGWHCSGSLCLPHSVTIIDYHRVCCER